MSDRSYISLCVHAVDPGEQEALLAVVNGWELACSSGDETEIVLHEPYSDEEVAIGSCFDLYRDIQAAAPSAVFEITQDPKYEYAGQYLAGAPGTEGFEASCDADGTPYIGIARMLSELRAVPGRLSVELWLATRGRELLGTPMERVLQQAKGSGPKEERELSTSGSDDDALMTTTNSSSTPSSQGLGEVRLLTVAEIASVIRVSKMTVYRLVHSGELPAIRVGRSFRVYEDAVRAYLGPRVL